MVTRWISAVTLALSLAVVGCPNGAATCSQHLQTRCADDVAQICNASGRWEDIANCAEVEGDFPFVCRQDSEGEHTCLPSL